MGGLVLAMIVGVLVPPMVVGVLGSKDPLPRNCASGQVSGTGLDGAILYTTGTDLWYSEGHPGQPRKLVDFDPRPSRLSPGGNPSPSTAPAATAPSASPSAPAQPTPRVVAADITADRRLVAMLVVDPLDRTGFVSLRMMSPLDPPGTAPIEGWFAQPDRQAEQAPQVRVLDNNKIVVIVGVPRSAIPPPSPAVSPPPSPSPSSSPSASPSAGPSPSTSVSTSPSVSASPPRPAPGTVVVVVDPATAKFVDVSTLDYFLAVAHSRWADTKSYRVPPSLPALRSRVDSAVTRVAGTVEREIGTPLARRRLNQVVVGRAGSRETKVVCSTGAETSLLAFSPDESGLALYDGRETLFLDLNGTHAATRLLGGKMLAWRG